ncbi:hypothetical protein FB451DRAFT_1177785 [Mycena latifolia]|nr:hypothetical protein FB451DRAFT_1177785 [Mycena latifolia]
MPPPTARTLGRDAGTLREALIARAAAVRLEFLRHSGSRVSSGASCGADHERTESKRHGLRLALTDAAVVLAQRKQWGMQGASPVLLAIDTNPDSSAHASACECECALSGRMLGDPCMRGGAVRGSKRVHGGAEPSRHRRALRIWATPSSAKPDLVLAP